MKQEVRILAAAQLELRAKADSSPMLRGYAAKFNVLSENLGGFREQIKPGAFDGVLGDDVRALINHEPTLILGRTTVGTARIGTDDAGLFYEADLPDTQPARDLATSIKRGDVSQSSFAFSISPGGDSWDEDPDTGGIIRTIAKIGRLYDVSAVTYPAYPDATVGMRSLELFQKELETRKQAKNRHFYSARRRGIYVTERAGGAEKRDLCPECGADVPDGEDVCPNCGSELIEDSGAK